MQTVVTSGAETAPATSSTHASRMLLLLVALAALAPVTLAAAAVHEVAPGETLSGIADELGVPVSALVAANSIANPDRIIAGQRLVIPSTTAAAPAAKTHKVVRGETLGIIAARYGVAPNEVASLNGIANPNLIIEGQALRIPAVAAPPGPAAPTTTSHVVAAGETLTKIARQHGVELADLVRLNSIMNPSLIIEGQVLVVPTAAARPAGMDAGVRDILRRVEREFSIPTGLLQAVAWQESGWQQHVVSEAGAVGITQLLPTTALWALEYLLDSAPDWRSSALDNARVGGSVLAHYLRLSNGDVQKSVAAYYQGWASLEEIGVYDETKDYLANVMALWAEFR